MSTTRRTLLRTLASLAALAPWAASAKPKKLSQLVAQQADRPREQLVRDEAFWRQIKLAYSVSPTLVNLNNGGVSPQPRVVQEAVEHYNRLSNETPSYYMWRILDAGREPLREKLADLAGCSAEEIAINRNATEALENVIFGVRLETGDEVVVSPFDYPNMANSWKQRALREGIVLKYAPVDIVKDSDASIVDAYVGQFGQRTKLVHITQLVHYTGRILPVKAIAEAARARGIEVLVDGAHAFAHLDFKIPDLGCDYFGTSLHKWLCAPFGSGMLYVRRDKIPRLYPLFGTEEPESDDIRKFEHLGTRSFAIEQGIAHAVDFHRMIGSALKQERLYYLKEYWVKQLADLPGFQLLTPRSPTSSGALTVFKLKDVPSSEVARQLEQKYRVHTVWVKKEELEGVRITPNVYTLTSDLDRFIKGVKAIAASAQQKD